MDIDVISNDIDVDGDLLSIVPGSLSTPTNGSVIDNGDGNRDLYAGHRLCWAG